MDTNKIISRIRAAFENYTTSPCSSHGERIAAILDAIENDMANKMIKCGYGERIPRLFDDDEDLLSLLRKDRLDCFTDGWNAYNFNPFKEDPKERFVWRAEYVTLDAYEHIVSIEDRQCLAFWYYQKGTIYDYISGNYGDPSDDAMDALTDALN